MEAWIRHQQRRIMWRKSPHYQQRKSRLFATCFTLCMTIDNRSAPYLFRKSPRKLLLLRNFKEASWLRVTDAEARMDPRLPIARPNDVREIVTGRKLNRHYSGTEKSKSCVSGRGPNGIRTRV